MRINKLLVIVMLITGVLGANYCLYKAVNSLPIFPEKVEVK